jgi:hypothetical protein
MRLSQISGERSMERYYPKIGKLAMAISVSQFIAVLFNGILGWFPAGFIGTGARGQKFHLLQYIRQSMNLPYKEGGFWSDAGTMTGQEYAMILLMMTTLIIAVFGLRQRPAIEGPTKMNVESQREQLESGQVAVSKPGGLSVVNPTTAAIVSSIVGGDDTPTSEIIANALGEMTAVAVEMGVDDFLVKGQIVQEEGYEPTIIDDEDDIVDLTATIDIVESEPVITTEDEADNDLGWLDDTDFADEPFPEPVSEPEPEPLPVPVKKKVALPNLPSTTERETKTVVAKTSPAVVAAIPEIVEVPQPVKEAHSGAMPTKPVGLHPKAEFDLEMNAWTLFGRRIDFTDTPPPPPTQQVTASVVTIPTPMAASRERAPPKLPTIPKPPNKVVKAKPRLPSIPQI